MKKTNMVIVMLLCLVTALLTGCGNSASVDMSQYVGAWTEEEVSSNLVPSTLGIEIDGGNLIVQYDVVQEPPAYRVAMIEETIPLSKIENGVVEFKFEDSWENTGVISLQFCEGSIICNVKDVTYVGEWGAVEGTYAFLAHYDSFETMAAVMDQYYVEEELPQENQPQNYNPSTANGILAQLGLTEEGFKQRCQIFSYVSNKENAVYSKQDFREYPNDYVGAFVKIEGTQVPKFHVESKEQADDGSMLYVDYSGRVILIDMRDDVYGPNISEGEFIVPYCIFDRMQTINGHDYLIFYMIAVEKS